MKAIKFLLVIFLVLILSAPVLVAGEAVDITPKMRSKAQVELKKRDIDYKSIGRYFYEIEENHLNEVELILQAGFINANTKDNWGDAGLHVTARDESLIAMMELLLKYGADLESSNDKKNTPLHETVIYKNHTGIKILIARNVNLEARNIYGRTPITYAGFKNDITAVNELYKAGADPTAKVVNGKLAILNDMTTRDLVIYWSKKRKFKHIDYKPMIARLEELEVLWEAKQKNAVVSVN